MKLRHLLSLAALIAIFVLSLTAPLCVASDEKVMAAAEEHEKRASALSDKGDYAGAEKEWRTLLTMCERALGAEHPSTVISRGNLAEMLGLQGKYAEAEREYRVVLPLLERMVGVKRWETLKCRNNLAEAMQAQGKWAEGEVEHRAILALREEKDGANHSTIFESCYNLALCLAEQKKFPEALVVARRAEEGWMRKRGAEDPHTLKSVKLHEEIEAAMKK